MIKNILFKDKVFKDKKELYFALKDNEETILGLKKASVYKSIDKGQGIFNIPVLPKTHASKVDFKSGFIYPAINSTHWLDSHQDVHIKGCYKRTVKQQQGRVYYIDTHLKGLLPIITRKKHVEMFYDDVEWKLLGKDIEGSTEALFFKIAEEHVKLDYLQLIKEDKELQNSLAMMYKKIGMAIDSKDPAFKENKDLFEKYIDTIANKDQAIKDGIFFPVEELAIMGEGSLCPVVGGSNSATSVIQIENIQAEKSLEQKQEEAERSLQEEQLKELLNKIKI